MEIFHEGDRRHRMPYADDVSVKAVLSNHHHRALRSSGDRLRPLEPSRQNCHQAEHGQTHRATKPRARAERHRHNSPTPMHVPKELNEQQRPGSGTTPQLRRAPHQTTRGLCGASSSTTPCDESRPCVAVSKARRRSPMMPPPLLRTAVSYTHLRAHETDSYLVCRLL